MKILVHGRKNGYSVLYPKPTPKEFYSFASDIQSISANNYDIYYGKQFYTLALVDGGCIFSKYIIGDDQERGQLGEIGISIFIPNTHKLPGADLKTLLDELINTYCINYFFDNKIVEPKTGFEWLLFATLANSYDAKLLPRSTINDNITTGTQDPAFHYYTSDNKLIEYFDKPYQEEYNYYKQILFIDNNLQGPANPLNVLRNSGIEVNPDLKNEYYYLNNYNISKGIKISANFNNKWNERSDRKGNNQIRAKWPVEINCFKDYYKPIQATGSISNPSSEIHKYLEINGNNILIKYEAFLPEPETKTFTLNVITKKDGAIVTDAEIQVDSKPWQPLSHVTFTAEELGREHKIVARRGDNLFSDVLNIIPKYYSEVSIPLLLFENRVVKITAKDQENGDIIWQFKVHITGKDSNKVTDQIEFVGDEIDKEWNIQIIECKEYINSENKKFCPATDGNEIIFELKKAKKYSTRPGTSGDSDNNPHNKSEQQKSFTAKTKSIFSKPGFIAVGIFVLIIGILLLIYFLKKNEPKVTPISATQITAYVNGDSLFFNELNDYKRNWKCRENDFITKSGGGIFGGDEKADSTKLKSDWLPANESIERALIKRILINEKNFAELKNLRYSNQQFSFSNAIEKIDSTNYTKVREELGDVSALTLTQIAEKINKILILNEPVKEEIPKETKKEIEQPNKNNEKTNQEETIETNATTNENNNQDNRIAENQEEDFQSDFWKIVHKDTAPSKNDFDNWYRKGSEILYRNEYKVFYNENFSKSEDFEKFKDFFKKPAIDRKKVKKLDDLKNQIK